MGVEASREAGEGGVGEATSERWVERDTTEPVYAPGLQPYAYPLKVLVVGDSITHGHEADYTWRYRLWEWFRDNDVPVQFVGPYVGTNPPAQAEPVGDENENENETVQSGASSGPIRSGSRHSSQSRLQSGSRSGSRSKSRSRSQSRPRSQSSNTTSTSLPRTNGRYASDVDPAFFDSGCHHFALWGYQAHQAAVSIHNVVAKYQPDLLLVALGFNDLGWFVNGPKGTLADVRTIVDRAREAQPNLRFGLANVPQRSRLGGRDDLPVSTGIYNTMLSAACKEWSTSTSPVHLVRLRETYDCDVDSCPGAYDGLHPNALGEFQIAKAFSQTLHKSYGLGKDVLQIPDEIPPRPCPVPANLRVRPVGNRIVATWDHAFGAYGYFALNRAAGSSDGWQGSQFVTVQNRSDTMWIAPGVAWEFKVQSDCGSGQRSAFTEVKRAVRKESTDAPTEAAGTCGETSDEQKPLGG